MVIQCTNCSTALLRGELQQHIENDCINALINCEFKYAGCNTQFQRKDQLKHNNETAITHVSLLARYVGSMKQQLKNQQGALTCDYAAFGCMHRFRYNVWSNNELYDHMKESITDHIDLILQTFNSRYIDIETYGSFIPVELRAIKYFYKEQLIDCLYQQKWLPAIVTKCEKHCIAVQIQAGNENCNIDKLNTLIVAPRGVFSYFTLMNLLIQNKIRLYSNEDALNLLLQRDSNYSLQDMVNQLSKPFNANNNNNSNSSNNTSTKTNSTVSFGSSINYEFSAGSNCSSNRTFVAVRRRNK
jgi:hypothetical protein